MEAENGEDEEREIERSTSWGRVATRLCDVPEESRQMELPTAQEGLGATT